MKKFILIILLITILSQAAFCETKVSPRQKAFEDIQKTNRDFYNQCNDLANAFKKDAKFANFLRNTCSDYEFRREKSILAVYAPKNNYNVTNYANYYANKVEFIRLLNEQSLNMNKEVAKEYCKYNKKNFPEACKKLN